MGRHTEEEHRRGCKGDLEKEVHLCNIQVMPQLEPCFLKMRFFAANSEVTVDRITSAAMVTDGQWTYMHREQGFHNHHQQPLHDHLLRCHQC